MSNYLTENIQKYVKFMEQEGLCQNTINQYVSCIKKLTTIDTRLYRLTNNQIQNFILSSNSYSAQNCNINAIKKYYKYIHPNKRIKVFIRPKQPKVIKDILSINEVWKLINSIEHYKQKAIITGIYLHGLRISEISKLKYTDIDKENNHLIIRQGKGKKDRKVPLHNNWLEYLKIYAIKEKHTKGYDKPIFEPYSKSSIRAFINRHVIKTGITKKVYPHLLRDCYASHLLESGYDISIIQEILGHEKLETTRKYIHISGINISNVKLKIIHKKAS